MSIYLSANSVAHILTIVNGGNFDISKGDPFLYSNPWMRSYSVFGFSVATPRGDD